MSGNKSIKITNIVTEYLHYYQEHTKKYEKGLVFMQVGSFYEAYEQIKLDLIYMKYRV